MRRPVGQGSQGERAPWSQLHWGWQRPWAGRGPGWWRRRAVLAPGQPPRLRGPAGSGRTRGGASPSPCAGRRSRSTVLHCSRCTSRWPCAHSSSSSGLGGGDGQGWATPNPPSPQPSCRMGKDTLYTNGLGPSQGVKRDPTVLQLVVTVGKHGPLGGAFWGNGLAQLHCTPLAHPERFMLGLQDHRVLTRAGSHCPFPLFQAALLPHQGSNTECRGPGRTKMDTLQRGVHDRPASVTSFPYHWAPLSAGHVSKRWAGTRGKAPGYVTETQTCHGDRPRCSFNLQSLLGANSSCCPWLTLARPPQSPAVLTPPAVPGPHLAFVPAAPSWDDTVPRFLHAGSLPPRLLRRHCEGALTDTPPSFPHRSIAGNAAGFTSNTSMIIISHPPACAHVPGAEEVL